MCPEHALRAAWRKIGEIRHPHLHPLARMALPDRPICSLRQLGLLGHSAGNRCQQRRCVPILRFSFLCGLRACAHSGILSSLVNPAFLPDGGTIGFYCRHPYDEGQLAQTEAKLAAGGTSAHVSQLRLKREDAVIAAVLAAAGLKVRGPAVASISLFNRCVAVSAARGTLLGLTKSAQISHAACEVLQKGGLLSRGNRSESTAFLNPHLTRPLA